MPWHRTVVTRSLVRVAGRNHNTILFNVIEPEM